MEETNKHRDNCKTASLFNPVIAQESSVGIKESKNKERLQGDMEDTKTAKERFTGDREVCSKERTYLAEENFKSYSDATNQFKGSIVGITKKDDENEAFEAIE